jgi:hypothetical protein
LPQRLQQLPSGTTIPEPTSSFVGRAHGSVVKTVGDTSVSDAFNSPVVVHDVPRTIRIRQDAGVTTAEPAVARDQVINRVAERPPAGVPSVLVGLSVSRMLFARTTTRSTRSQAATLEAGCSSNLRQSASSMTPSISGADRGVTEPAWCLRPRRAVLT